MLLYFTLFAVLVSPGRMMGKASPALHAGKSSQRSPVKYHYAVQIAKNMVIATILQTGRRPMSPSLVVGGDNGGAMAGILLPRSLSIHSE